MCVCVCIYLLLHVEGDILFADYVSGHDGYDYDNLKFLLTGWSFLYFQEKGIIFLNKHNRLMIYIYIYIFDNQF